MKVFLVGGAVRDIAMGLVPKDFDFVVTGSNPDEMMAMGFEQVGSDFPVFLHPLTKDEFALARIERKVGEGHKGFACHWEDVTLENDLLRRDLTINAMAVEMPMEHFDSGFLDITFDFEEEDIIDPFEGLRDIKQQSLFHVSPSFEEDPLRVLRVARFMARLGTEWRLHHSLKLTMKRISNNGDLETLSAERIWKETERALMEKHPQMFFETLEGLGVFPELDALRGVPQREDHHPEKDTFIHVMMCLEQAGKMNLSLEARFAVLVHDLGKRPLFDKFGNLHGHEGAGVSLVDKLCDRIKATNKCRELGRITSEHHTRVHRVFDQTGKKVFKVLEVTDAIRNPKRFEEFLKACEADARGRLGFEDREYPQREFMLTCLKAAQDLDTQAIAKDIKENRKRKNEERRAEGKEDDQRPLGSIIGEAIRCARISAVKNVYLMR